MDPPSWDKLVRAFHRDIEKVVNRHVEGLQKQKQVEITLCGTNAAFAKLNPYFLPSRYDAIRASHEEENFSSDQMDKIRTIQRWWHTTVIRKKWTTTLALYKASQDAQSRRKRFRKIQSLLESERAYYETLDMIITKYLIPLRRHIAPVVVNLSDIDGLFSNLTTIAYLSGKLLRQLEIQFQRWPLFPFSIGQAFCNLAMQFKVYSEYVENYCKSLCVLSELQKSEGFRNWVKSIAENGNEHVDGKELSEYLMAPARRLLQYKSLLAQLLNLTEESHVEYEHLQKASLKVNHATETLQFAMGQAENVLQVFEIQTKFHGEDVPNLVRSYRRFVRYATLHEVAETPISRFVVLFNDLCVIGSDNRGEDSSCPVGSYKFLKALPLRYATVKSIPDHPPTFTNAFMLATPSVGSVISFSCQSEGERDEWLRDFTKILEALEADYFSLDSEDISHDNGMDGYLSTYQKQHKKWIKRWCTFDHGAFHLCDNTFTRELSVIVRECRLNLLADSETGRRYCFCLDNPFTGESLLLSAPDKDTFDFWVNALMPVSNQTLADSSDDDLQLLHQDRVSKPEDESLNEEKDREVFVPPQVEEDVSGPGKFIVRRHIGEWKEYVDSLGSRYFENTRTQKTTQEVPSAFQ